MDYINRKTVALLLLAVFAFGYNQFSSYLDFSTRQDRIDTSIFAGLSNVDKDITAFVSSNRQGDALIVEFNGSGAMGGHVKDVGGILNFSFDNGYQFSINMSDLIATLNTNNASFPCRNAEAWVEQKGEEVEIVITQKCDTNEIAITWMISGL